MPLLSDEQVKRISDDAWNNTVNVGSPHGDAVVMHAIRTTEEIVLAALVGASAPFEPGPARLGAHRLQIAAVDDGDDVLTVVNAAGTDGVPLVDRDCLFAFVERSRDHDPSAQGVRLTRDDVRRLRDSLTRWLVAKPAAT